MANPSGTNPAVEEITVGGALFKTGSGAPTFAAAKGSLFVRTDTGASTTATRLYVNTTGSTVWTNITTAA
jgi:hypothetical protein